MYVTTCTYSVPGLRTYIPRDVARALHLAPRVCLRWELRDDGSVLLTALPPKSSPTATSQEPPCT